jgi:hypothetical protein
MKKKDFAIMLAALLTANVQADTVGLYLGGQVWQSEASGVFGEKNAVSNFNLKKEQQSNYFVVIEHPFPLLPNIRISSTTFDTTGKTTSTQGYSDDNETSHVDVHVDFDVDASFNVSYIDYTLYYELFDNGLFSFDLGLTARDFGGGVIVSETANIVTTTRDYIWDGAEHDEHDYHNITETTKTVTKDNVKTNDIEPMLYVATNISLPLTGLSVFAQGDYLLMDDHLLYDYQVGLSYDLVDSTIVDFNLTLGYRVVKMEVEDLDSLYTNLEFKGVFAGVILHF